MKKIEDLRKELWISDDIKVELPGFEPGSGEGIDSAFYMFIGRCFSGRARTTKILNLSLSD